MKVITINEQAHGDDGHHYPGPQKQVRSPEPPERWRCEWLKKSLRILSARVPYIPVK
jgi:hypothetical protein